MFSSLVEAYGPNNYDSESDNFIAGNLLKSSDNMNTMNENEIHYSSATGDVVDEELPFPRSRNISIHSTPMNVRPANKKKSKPISTCNIQDNRADSFRFQHGDTTFYSDENSHSKYNTSTVNKFNQNVIEGKSFPNIKSTYLQPQTQQQTQQPPRRVVQKLNKVKNQNNDDGIDVRSLIHRVDHLLSVIENLVRTKKMSSWVRNQKNQLVSRQVEKQQKQEEEEEEEEEEEYEQDADEEQEDEDEDEEEERRNNLNNLGKRRNNLNKKELSHSKHNISKQNYQFSETKDIVLHAILGTILGAMVIFLLELFFRFITK